MRLHNTYRTIEVKPLSGVVGAEIFGADLSSDVDDEQFFEIRNAFHAHGVIFFREQELSPEQHIAFARRWGNINVNRFFRPVDGYPLIAEVLKEPRHEHNIGGGWHTDHSYDVSPRSARYSMRAKCPKPAEIPCSRAWVPPSTPFPKASRTCCGA